MDLKNIMWDNGNSWVIDLECLDYGDPISHAFQLALQWSGISEVRNTVERIKYIRNIEKEIKEALNSRLPEIKADRYDNHDERICYYKLLLESNITEVLQYELPKGYRIL